MNIPEAWQLNHCNHRRDQTILFLEGILISNLIQGLDSAVAEVLLPQLYVLLYSVKSCSKEHFIQWDPFFFSAYKSSSKQSSQPSWTESLEREVLHDIQFELKIDFTDVKLACGGKVVVQVVLA